MHEVEEARKDIKAFSTAYNIIRDRILEVRDENRLLHLTKWSGTDAVTGSLELTIHALERAKEELEDLLYRIDSGIIGNQDET